MYREIAPPPQLAPLVACFWRLRAAEPLADVRRKRVLPDGCSDFIFDLGDPSSDPGAPYHGLRSYAVGTMRTAIVVGLTGRVDLLGVRFRPGGLAAVTGVRADELTDRTVPLATLFPAASSLEARLLGAALPARVGIVAAAIEELDPSGRRGPDPRVQRAAALIERSAGAARVDRIAAEVRLSRRQLERLFRAEVGVSPKEACRVARLQAAARRLRSAGPVSLAGVAYGTGFHDQSHMTREFVRLAGVTPAAFAREPALVPLAPAGGPSSAAR